MLLSASLKSKKFQFCLVLDNLWSPLNLQELGVKFGHNKYSKIVFSTWKKDLIPAMRVEKYIEIQSLSQDEAWMLLISEYRFQWPHCFWFYGYKGVWQENCRRVYKGLHLAISVVTVAMIGKSSVIDWEISLDLMKTAHLAFPNTHHRVDPELYQRLRWNYDDLPISCVKSCFLYCGLYPERSWNLCEGISANVDCRGSRQE